MALSRPPHSTGTVYSDRQFVWQLKNGPWASSGSYAGHEASDYRPSYLYGSRTTLPGGKVYRLPTAYYRVGKRIASITPCKMVGQTTWQDPVYGYREYVGECEAPTYLSYYTANRLIADRPVDMRNEAVTKAMNKLAGSRASLGENLAEFSQVLGLFTGKISFLKEGIQSVLKNRSFRPFLRKKFGELARNPLNKAAELYLETVYGWIPLMADIKGTLELLQQRSAGAMLIRASAGSQRTSSKSESNWRTFSSSVARLSNATCDSVATCTLYAQINPSGSGLRALNQLGLANPLQLAWNLLDFSFVVDWVLPIGQVLGALTAPMGLTFVSGTVSFRHTQTGVIQFKQNGSNIYESQWGTKSVTPGVCTVIEESYFRDVQSGGFPLPGVWIDPNPFRRDRPLKALALAIVTLHANFHSS